MAEVEKAEVHYRHPFGVTSDNESDTIVKTFVVFPGLKKKVMKDEAANAEVDLKFPSERSMDLKLTMVSKANGKEKRDHYRYHIKRLPDDILPDKCSHKVKKDKVVITLVKAKPRSWEADLAETGLETCVDDEIEDTE